MTGPRPTIRHGTLEEKLSAGDVVVDDRATTYDSGMTDKPPTSSAPPTRPPGPEAAGAPLANWSQRLGTWLIDWLILALGGLLVLMALSQVVNALLAMLSMLVFVLLYWGGHLTGRVGRTPGKAALGLRVVSVSDRASVIGFGRGVGRFVASAAISIVPVGFVIDHLWPLWDDQNQTLHDKAVRSVVISER